MRKRAVNHLADTIFWYLLYFLPVIVLIFVTISHKESTITFSDVFLYFGLRLSNDNIIYSTLNHIFGVGGIFPLFQDVGILYMFTWFISCLICHVVVDVILFFPRLSHTFLDKYSRLD